MISSANRPARLARALVATLALVSLRDAVATAWGIEPDRVHVSLEPGAAAPAPGAPLRMAGRPSADGHFVAVVHESSGTRALRVRAGLLGARPVATRALPTGCTLGDDDVRFEERIAWGSPAAAREGTPGAGWRTRRPIAAGDVIEPPAVMAPRLVAAGDPVTVVWRRGLVRLSFAATALAGAGEGESIAVRAAGRTGRLVATAVAPGIVALAGGER